MASPRTKWECPIHLHATVLGPRKPRRDDVCRYCLACSANKGRLVLRAAPVVEKQRAARTEKRLADAKLRQARAAEREAAYYTWDGVNMHDKLVEFTKLPVFREERGNCIWKHVPVLRIRRCTMPPRTRYGFCRYGAPARISVSVWPGWTAQHALETLLHEVVHAFCGPTGYGRSRCHHGPKFKAIMREASEQAFGVRPKLKTRYHGEVTRLVREKVAAESGAPTVAEEALQAHYATLGRPVPAFQCDNCNASFKREAGLTAHRERQHGIGGDGDHDPEMDEEDPS